MILITITEIMRAIYYVIYTILKIVYKIVRVAIIIFFTIMMRIMSYVAFLLPFSPFALVVICIFIVLAILWDTVTKPIIYGILEVINGIIGGWNKVADGVRNIGVKIPGMGYLRLGGIDLGSADEIEADIPDFAEFILSIIKPMVLIPLEAALKGVIIR